MSEDLVDEPFKGAAKREEAAYDRSAKELMDNVQKSKSDALKKISQ